MDTSTGNGGLGNILHDPYPAGIGELNRDSAEVLSKFSQILQELARVLRTQETILRRLDNIRDERRSSDSRNGIQFYNDNLRVGDWNSNAVGTYGSAFLSNGTVSNSTAAGEAGALTPGALNRVVANLRGNLVDATCPADEEIRSPDVENGPHF